MPSKPKSKLSKAKKATSARTQKKQAPRKNAVSTRFSEMYKQLLYPRLIEEKMLLLLRQGRVSKWFSGIGQEAISVGCTLALKSDEFILPLHRNLGVFTTRGVPLDRLIAQWQGKEAGFTKGRDRSFHFGTLDYSIIGMISHLGPQMGVADGIALASKLKKEKKVTLVFSGEGGTSEGDFHEAINVASVWDLPVIFVIENNGYALSTPTREQFRCEKLSSRAAGYGIQGVTIDGNDLLTVFETVTRLADSMRRNPRPVILECMTFRMRGHEEASGTKYVPKKLFTEWEKRDPIAAFEKVALKKGRLKKADLAQIRAELCAHIDTEVEKAFSYADVSATLEHELEDVYPASLESRGPMLSTLDDHSGDRRSVRFIDALSDGLREEMRADSSLVLLGQDIAEYGGVFKVTDGFVKEFGRERVRNTPLCESAIVGAALGLSARDIPAIVEMQFADFVTCGFNQIVNNLAKAHYRWGLRARVVVRMPTGAGTGAGPFHSQSNEAWFTHTPGLKVVYPSTPFDAKGLIAAAVSDGSPVMFFEHKALYRSISGEVPSERYEIPLGKASFVREGSDAYIITYGAGVHWASAYVEANPERSIGILDLRTLAPLDYESIASCVRNAGRVAILHEDTMFGGIGGDIAAYIGEHHFEHLDAPVVRIASLDTPVPFAAALEAQFLAKARLQEGMERLLGY